MSQKLEGALQENVLTLLCYNAEYSSLLCSVLVPELFESDVYRDIAHSALEYSRKYKQPIGDHLADELEGILKQDDSKARFYRKTIYYIRDSYDGLNPDYVVSQLKDFVAVQNLKTAVVEAADRLQTGDVDTARSVLHKQLTQSQVSMFDSGTRLSNTSRALSFLSDFKEALFSLGIPALEGYDIIPQRGEMGLFIGAAKKGKSFWLVHVAKQALLSRLKVLYVTLEMNEGRVSQRIVQSLFSISKRDIPASYMLFDTDRHTNGLVLKKSRKMKRPSLQDPGIRKHLVERLEKLRVGKNLVIKEFPSFSLTMPALEAYMDMLSAHEGFQPDVLLVDYPDLFKHNISQKREELGSIFVALRGLAKQRNLALMTVTQGNRESNTARVVHSGMVAEDWSKIATADYIYTFSQTDPEQRLGLARLLISGARNDEGNQTVLLSQAYSLGQFIMDSALMAGEKGYWEEVDEQADRAEDSPDP